MQVFGPSLAGIANDWCVDINAPDKKVGWLVVCFGFNGPSVAGIANDWSIHISAPDKKVGWLFWGKQLFETVFQSISGHLPERGRKNVKDR